MRCRREGAVHWNRSYQQGGRCLPQGGSPEPQQSLQNGYFGSHLTKQITITFQDQTDLIYEYTLSLSQRFSILPTPNTRFDTSDRFARRAYHDSVVPTLCSRSSSAQIMREVSRPFGAAPRFLILGSNSAQLLLHFQAGEPLDVARHMASRLNALRPVTRCKRCPGLHHFIPSGILLHKAPAGGDLRIISEQFLYFDFRSSTGRLNIDFRWPARRSREHER
jgi:hypothetical protein